MRIRTGGIECAVAVNVFGADFDFFHGGINVAGFGFLSTGKFCREERTLDFYVLAYGWE